MQKWFSAEVTHVHERYEKMRLILSDVKDSEEELVEIKAYLKDIFETEKEHLEARHDNLKSKRELLETTTTTNDPSVIQFEYWGNEFCLPIEIQTE